MVDVVKFPLANIEATNNLAARVAKLLRARDVVALRGELGAGKTAFARGVLRALGIAEDVPSPTFTLVQPYETKAFSVYHFDLYRLKNPAELEEMGWNDACYDGVVLVEWPEHAEKAMPRDRLDIFFDGAPQGQRRATLTPQGAWAERLKDLRV